MEPKPIVDYTYFMYPIDERAIRYLQAFTQTTIVRGRTSHLKHHVHNSVESVNYRTQFTYRFFLKIAEKRKKKKKQPAIISFNEMPPCFSTQVAKQSYRSSVYNESVNSSAVGLEKYCMTVALKQKNVLFHSRNYLILSA